MKTLFKFIKAILVILILICIVVCSVVVVNGYKMYREKIDEVSIETKVESIRSDKNYITMDEIPTDFKNAIIAVEDHRFYEHGYIDIISIGRAVVNNIKTMSLAEGGSTITQQLAKNMYFTMEKKFTRKVAEVFVARKLEQMYTKDEILEMYINVAYFGDGLYGLKEAANGYFDKEPLELTFDEITLLAGRPNAPSAYSLSDNEDLARRRQQIVINQMKKYNFIDEN